MIKSKLAFSIILVSITAQVSQLSASTLPMDDPLSNIDFSKKKIIPAIESAENKKKLEENRKQLEQQNKDTAQQCADPKIEGTMANIQSEAIQKANKIATNPTNVERMFDLGKQNGCFAPLSRFPDLSLNIPSITGMLDQVQGLLTDYAVRKVCDAVDSAFSEMITPLNKAFNEVSSRGQLDMTGYINREIARDMHQIDPDLGKISAQNKSETGYELKW